MNLVMAMDDVIDLTRDSSPEPDESPSKLAAAVLNKFKPGVGRNEEQGAKSAVPASTAAPAIPATAAAPPRGGYKQNYTLKVNRANVAETGNSKGNWKIVAQPQVVPDSLTKDQITEDFAHFESRQRPRSYVHPPPSAGIQVTGPMPPSYHAVKSNAPVAPMVAPQSPSYQMVQSSAPMFPSPGSFYSWPKQPNHASQTNGLGRRHAPPQLDPQTRGHVPHEEWLAQIEATSGNWQSHENELSQRWQPPQISGAFPYSKSLQTPTLQSHGPLQHYAPKDQSGGTKTNGQIDQTRHLSQSAPREANNNQMGIDEVGKGASRLEHTTLSLEKPGQAETPELAKAAEKIVQDRSRTIASSPALAGSRLVIVEALSDSEDDIPRSFRRTKRVISTPPSVQSDHPPSKRQKLDDEGKDESAHQLDQELSSSAAAPPVEPESRFGIPYSAEEDELVFHLREVVGLGWTAMEEYFEGRTWGSIKVRYRTIRNRRNLQNAQPNSAYQTRRDRSPSVAAVPAESRSESRYRRYTAKEDDLLFHLKEVLGLRWADIATHFEGRTWEALQIRYSSMRHKRGPQMARHESIPQNRKEISSSPVVVPVESESRHGIPYSIEEDELLFHLKEVVGLKWPDITPYFKGRTSGSIQVRYSTIRNRKHAQMAHQPEASHHETQLPARRRARGGGPSAVDGFVSWAQVKQMRNELKSARIKALAETEEDEDSVSPENEPLFRQDRTYPSTISRMLRQRELGTNGGRAWASSKTINDELINHVFDNYEAKNKFENMSGDVTSLAWSSAWAEHGRGHKFVAGSVAITDDRSMQYNSNLNLLLGDYDKEELRDLPDHHIPRPQIAPDPSNVNSLSSMRETQDPRLFTTVAAVDFSPSGNRIYSAGHDSKVHVYSVREDIRKSKLRYSIPHAAKVDLLSVSKAGILATACHRSEEGSIGVYRCEKKTYEKILALSSGQTTSHATASFPAALRWGTAPRYQNLLLAGFSSESYDDEQDSAGGVALWDIEAGQQLSLSTLARNVFDIAWNSNPSSASSAFAVACMSSTNKPHKSMRSVVKCYAPAQLRAREVLRWHCPASDINDLIYCPHDDNLIAAGATDGKVYIWDKRFANKNQSPLHTLRHGNSTNVLDHDRDREDVDTGVRFLSWGATASRLYSGSSDGVLKTWNPYRSPENALIKDVATFTTAIMSGAFSPDYRDLLIGEECGRLNLLSLNQNSDLDTTPAKSARRFKLHTDLPADVSNESSIKAANDLIRTGRLALRPVGALPIRQVVQGPNYRGPFLKPSAEEWRAANATLDKALDLQNEAWQKTAMSSQNSENDPTSKKLELGVQEAQNALDQLQTRADAEPGLQMAAARNQLTLKAAFDEQKRIEALTGNMEKCKLDCNFLPRDNEEGAEVPDSQRSERRIPETLRGAPRQQLDLTDMNCRELFEAKLAPPCETCSAPRHKSSRMRAHFKMMCKSRCTRIKQAYTDRCERCAAPIKTSIAADGNRLCERCNFACIRCSKPAQLSDDTSRVHCASCGLTWSVNVLGFELEGHETRALKKITRKIDEDDDNYIDDSELEHYASLWK